MFRWWALVMAASMLSHPLLDWFTTYGTQLLAPFSRHRFAIDGVGIVDPFYSLTLIAGLSAIRWNAASPCGGASTWAAGR